MTLYRQAVIMPLTPKDMVEDLVHRYQFSMENLANALHTSPRTLYRVQNGERASSRLVSDMIRLYCVLAQNNECGE